MAVDALSAGALGGVVLVAVGHTVLGPDPYLPFAALSRARGWSLRRTLAVTSACGVGHVLPSVLPSPPRAARSASSRSSRAGAGCWPPGP